MTLVRADVYADVAEMTSAMTSAVTQRRVQRVSAWFRSGRNFCRRVLDLIRPILFRRRISEQVDSDDGGGELIGAVLKAHGNSAESLTGAWQRVASQMNWILAALCRLLENLHGDMSYVVIGGPMWKIRQRQ